MATPAKAPRSVVIRASRETIALALAACAVTFALAYAVHSKSDVTKLDVAKSDVGPVTQATSSIRAVPAKGSPIEGAQTREWTGHLADIGPPAAVAPGEPMTSASLVVSPSQLAPVTAPTRPTARRVCEGASCTARTSAPSPMPPSRPSQDGPDPAPVAVGAASPARNWPASINPLNHLPDATALKQPFTYVGDKVAGWFK